MSQFGGGRLGGVPLVAGGMVPQDFRALPRGPIAALFLTISFSLISSAAAFNLAVSTGASAAAEGADDMDIILDALFTSLTWYADEDHQVGSLKPSQWRTILGALNVRDFEGTMADAASVPISTGTPKAFKVTMTLPVSLQRYFKDGSIFMNGSRRLSTGRMEYNAGATLTPSVVLAHGTAAVSAVGVSITPETGAGTEDDVGLLWRVKRNANLPTVYAFDDQLRILIADVTPAASNAVTNYKIGDYEMWAPSDFQAKYQGERLITSGFDSTARCTPLAWLDKDTTLLDFNAHLGKQIHLDAVSGVSSLALYDVVAIPAPATTIQKVSQRVGSGGSVSLEHITPPSLPPFTKIPSALGPLLPVRITPGNSGVVGPGASKAGSPADAAAATAQKQIASARATSVYKLFGRK